MRPILTEADLMYLAGLFDGEGTAGSYLKKTFSDHPRKSRQFCYTLAISMADPDPVYFAALCFGGNVYLREQSRNAKGSMKMYCWRLSATNAYNTALALLPFVKNEHKVTQLQAVIDSYQTNHKGR